MAVSLNKSSYKGFDIYITQEDLKEGLLTKEHLYPNFGNEQFRFQEVILNQPITIEVSIVFTGNDYLFRFEKFKELLQETSAGTLISQAFGRFENMRIANIPTWSTSLQNGGLITGKVEFKRTFDLDTTTTTLLFENLAENINNLADAVFTANYFISNVRGFALNIEQAFRQLQIAVNTSIATQMQFVNALDNLVASFKTNPDSDIEVFNLMYLTNAVTVLNSDSVQYKNEIANNQLFVSYVNLRVFVAHTQAMLLKNYLSKQDLLNKYIDITIAFKKLDSRVFVNDFVEFYLEFIQNLIKMYNVLKNEVNVARFENQGIANLVYYATDDLKESDIILYEKLYTKNTGKSDYNMLTGKIARLENV